MRKTTKGRTAIRGARLAAIGAGILLLAGCATGYSFVQPEVAGSGGYYTSAGPYSGQGYYDYYGTGPYYPGTGGYGYYDGTWPYGGAYGYYPGYYGYGPQWSFNLGISNAWNFPGYWGPWYSTGFPLGGCYSWRCGSRHYGHDHHRDHDSGSWRHAGSTPGTSDVAGRTQEGDVNAGRERAREMNAWRHDHFVRSPRWGATTGRFAAMPVAPVRMGEPAPGPTSFVGRRADPVAASVGRPAPAFSRAPRAAPAANAARPMAVRPAPAPAVQPAARPGTAPAVKIR